MQKQPTAKLRPNCQAAANFSTTQAELDTMSTAMTKAKAMVQAKTHTQIESMFDEIAPVYDFLNRVLSLGLDQHWRRAAVRMAYSILNPTRTLSALDVATGTGDFAQILTTLPNARVIGIDLSEVMLRYARQKVPNAHFERAAAEDLPFAKSSFDLVTVGFGARNFQDVEKGLLEIHRVLKPEGIAVFLEPMIPQRTWIRKPYLAYFKHILPKIACFFGAPEVAYRYLPLSVESFPQGEAFLEKLGRARFQSASQHRLSLQTAILYIARK